MNYDLEQIIQDINQQHGQDYPCGNQIVICGIITRSRDKAVAEMNLRGAKLIRQQHNYMEWELHGGCWIWCNWSMDVRGFRFYEMLIDKDIDDDLLEFSLIYSSFYCHHAELF